MKKGVGVGQQALPVCERTNHHIACLGSEQYKLRLTRKLKTQHITALLETGLRHKGQNNWYLSGPSLA